MVGIQLRPEDVIKFTLDDVLSSVENKTGAEIVMAFAEMNPHAGPPENEGALRENTPLGGEMNWLAKAICIEQGIPIEGNQVSVFVKDDRYIIDGPTVDEPTSRRVIEVVNELFRHTLEERWGTQLQQEFAYLEELMRGIKLFDWAFFLSFDAKHGLRHSTLQEVHYEINGYWVPYRSLGADYKQRLIEGDIDLAFFADLGITPSEASRISKGKNRWIFLDKNRRKVGEVYEVRVYPRSYWIGVFNEHEKYLIQIRDGGLDVSVPNTTPYETERHGEVKKTSDLYKRAEILYERLVKTAEFQFGSQLLDYDGEFTILHRLAKFIALNRFFAPERFDIPPDIPALGKRYEQERGQ